MTNEHAMTQTDTITTFYPPHPPRVATDVYVKSHHELTVVKNAPCWACGITHADILQATNANIAAGMAMETHHFWCEDAFTGEGAGTGGIHWPRIQADHPTFDWAGSGFVLEDPASWKHFVDSEFNLQVLCSACHRASRPVPHWLRGMADTARGYLVWPSDAASVGIHHATYPEYRDQRHNRPDEPPFRTALLAPPPVTPHVLAVDADGAAALLTHPVPGHTIVGAGITGGTP